MITNSLNSTKVVLIDIFCSLLYCNYSWNLLFCGISTVAQQEVIVVLRNIFHSLREILEYSDFTTCLTEVSPSSCSETV